MTDDRRLTQIGIAYGHLRAAIDRFAEATGHGLKIVINPPRGSTWPRVEMVIGARQLPKEPRP